MTAMAMGCSISPPSPKFIARERSTTPWEGLLVINPIAIFGDGQCADGLIWKYKKEEHLSYYFKSSLHFLQWALRLLLFSCFSWLKNVK